MNKRVDQEFIKQTLDNCHTILYNATHKDLFSLVENLEQDEFVKIEYNKIPNRKTEAKQIKTALTRIAELNTFTSKKEYKNIIEEVLKAHKGEHKTVYYKRGENFRNESGYLLFQDENNNWKSVDIRNTISITNTNGIKLTRLGQ